MAGKSCWCLRARWAWDVADLGLHRDRLNDLVMRQACAAVGQSLLMHEYEKLFQAHGVQLAQVLLTEGDFVDRNRYSNLRQTMEALLKLGVLPIVNENDTVSTAELDYLNIRAGERIFSDNDRLAALVMSHIEADVLVLLTDVEGLMQLAPSTTASGSVIPLVEEISPEAESTGARPVRRRARRDADETRCSRNRHASGRRRRDRERQEAGHARPHFRGRANRARSFCRRRAWRESAAGSPTPQEFAGA